MCQHSAIVLLIYFLGKSGFSTFNPHLRLYSTVIPHFAAI